MAFILLEEPFSTSRAIKTNRFAYPQSRMEKKVGLSHMLVRDPVLQPTYLK